MTDHTNSELRQVLQKLCMMNNKFMNLMLDDNIDAAQIMLRVILKDDTIKVISVRIQDFIQNLFGHSAQLDILAKDSTGRLFNVEIQRSDEGAPAKRARFYSSALDTRFLRNGADYVDLPDTYVIFITENDVLQDNLPIYNVQRTIKQSNRPFADGSHIIYVNSQCRDNTALGYLMQDLHCTEPARLHYSKFGKRMKFLKDSKEGEEKMTDILDLYIEKKIKERTESRFQQMVAQKAEEIAEQRAEQKTEQIVLNLLKNGITEEIAAKAADMPLAEVRELAKRLSA